MASTQHTPEYTQSELPAIDLFQALGYDYFDASQDDSRDSIHEVILADRLKASLQRINPWLDENNLNKAVRQVSAIAAESLMEANEQVHKLLINAPDSSFTLKHAVNGKEQHLPVQFIDFAHPENNDFLVVNQMKFKGQERNSIPDIVVFLNGLPLAVIECKAPTSQDALERAIGDLRYYQRNSEKLFHYNQVCAGLYRVGGRYAAIGAKSIHYQVFKSDDNADVESLVSEKLGRSVIEQDVLIFNLFEKRRFLDLMRNFVLFELDEGTKIKKLPRYQQIRAVNKTITKLQDKGQGGVIWHTQGSGKSLTMLYLATKLKREETGFDNPTVIVMTDRTDLDQQITKTFQNCGFPNPLHANSIDHLRQFLKDSYGKTIMTTIQKFQESAEEEARKQNPQKVEVLNDSPNIFVLTDEAHRSQYGLLAAFMRSTLPNAKFIAFTGTPIDKEEKSTLGSFYGGDYIDVYNIKQAVEDGATLDIKYQDGIPELYVEKELLEKQYDYYFAGESDEKKAKLKKEATALKRFMQAEKRIERIAEHLIEHYRSKVFPAGHKAMVVCYNRAAAIAYKKAFDTLAEMGQHSFKTRIVMSFSPKKDPAEYFKLATPEQDIKAAVEAFKLPFGDEQTLDKAGKKQFNNDAILIVSDMLLTGFDAPIVQVLYLDKPLKEHNLLQAIARVNRTRSGKTAGLIVDYSGITEHLTEALAIFAGELNPSDVMTSLKEEQARLDLRHKQMAAFFKHISKDRTQERTEFIDLAVQYIEPEDLRDEFKNLLTKFNKSMDIVLPDAFALRFEYDFKVFNEIRLQARNAFVDDNLRITEEDSKKLQKLIDEHLRASGIESLLEEPVSIIDRKQFQEEIRGTFSTKSKELKMSHRLRHTIQIELDKNPAFYRPLAEQLEELIEKRKEERISQLDFLKELEAIQDKIANKHQEAENMGFASERDFAVYKSLEDVLDGDAKVMTLATLGALEGELNIVDWQNKSQIQKEMRRKIKEILRGKLPDADLDQLSRTLVEQLKKN